MASLARPETPDTVTFADPGDFIRQAKYDCDFQDWIQGFFIEPQPNVPMMLFQVCTSDALELVTPDFIPAYQPFQDQLCPLRPFDS